MTAPPLEIDFSARQQVPYLLVLAPLLLASVLVWVFDVVPGWLGAACTVVLGLVVAYGLLLVWCLRTGVRAALLDDAGVTVPGAETVPWSDLREVVLGTVRPDWLLGSRRLRVVSLLPRPGVSLPGPPGLQGRPQEKGRPTRHRLYGTNLVLQTSLLSVGGEQVAAAAHDLGGLPVRRVPHRAARRWRIVLGAGVVLGVLGGVVSSLVG